MRSNAFLDRGRALPVLVLVLLASSLMAATQSGEGPTTARTERLEDYLLGPGDEVTVSVLGIEELADKTVRVSTAGDIELLLVGRISAVGRTVQELGEEIAKRLAHYMETPEVAVNLTEFRSQNVSVIGAVNEPGVHPLEGTKTLVEVLSLAGGLRPDAGFKVTITRRSQNGPIPLPNAIENAEGTFVTAEVNLPALLEARNPQENILIYPDDVVSVPRAKFVYVIGEVAKPGELVMGERESISALKALAMAGGFRPASAGKKAKILRGYSDSHDHQEIALDLNKVIAGEIDDVKMLPDDILFVPNSKMKTVGKAVIDAAIRTATSVIIWSSR